MKFLSFLLLFISFNSFAESNFEKAEKLFQQEKWDQAKMLFEDCIKQNPKDYKSIEYLGDIAGHQKRWEDAIGYYKTLKIQFPKTANYWYKYRGALG